ncbi:hypothetical protein NEICINOT_04610 [Neisseria cinerea ATCC 14685]|uniref:Uncharacterized protein n=1 Tax=Neisseria cinerea ATCC 14685 TaxID=546262 RepID=D0W4L2_NEICI|nr:hypothetical protein NEICINOT_04610 [Neisseria cinerea ATCC 14685]
MNFVVIPDLWGKSSDIHACDSLIMREVVIPDLWGKSSDCISSKNLNVFKHLQC